MAHWLLAFYLALPRKIYALKEEIEGSMTVQLYWQETKLMAYTLSKQATQPFVHRMRWWKAGRGN
ncbi:hypothetical protein KY284_029952 [Solanum tuberosum]|nr:hypothetical protein KY284_029952 [Solanum tuberosum]